MGDSLSIILGYFAQIIAGRPSDRRKIFGYQRTEILSAMANCLFLIIEAIKRLQQPEQINGQIMIAVAIIGTLANLVSALLLHRGSKNNLNIKATYLHILSDVLSLVAVIGGILITFVKVPWLDPLLTIIVALYIVKEA